MKKYWIGLLCGVILAGLSGCTENKNSDPPQTTEKNMQTESTEKSLQPEPFDFAQLPQNTYEDHSLGVRVQYPSEWIAEENPISIITSFSISKPEQPSASLSMGAYNHTEILENLEPASIERLLNAWYFFDELSINRNEMSFSERAEMKLNFIGEIEERMVDGHSYKKYEFEAIVASKTLFYVDALLGSSDEMETLIYYEYTNEQEKMILEGILDEIEFDSTLAYKTFVSENLGLSLEYPFTWYPEEIKGAPQMHIISDDLKTDIWITMLKDATQISADTREFKANTDVAVDVVKEKYVSDNADISVGAKAADESAVEIVKIANTDFMHMRYYIEVKSKTGITVKTIVNDYYDGDVNGVKYIITAEHQYGSLENAWMQHFINSFQIPTKSH